MPTQSCGTGTESRTARRLTSVFIRILDHIQTGLMCEIRAQNSHDSSTPQKIPFIPTFREVGIIEQISEIYLKFSAHYFAQSTGHSVT